MDESTPVEFAVAPAGSASADGVVPAESSPPKRRTSRALRGPQRLERRVSKAAHRMARAVEKGIAKYRRERDRSADDRRDGALRDLPVNLAAGMTAALREASRVPVDLAKGMSGRRAVKVFRRSARMVLRPLAR